MTSAGPRRERSTPDPTHAAPLFDLGAIVRIGLLGLLGTLAMLGVGATVLFGPIRSADEAVFDALVPWLQSASWLVSASEVVTDLGSKSLTYATALLLAIVLAVLRRSLLAPALVGVSVLAIHTMQWLAVVVIDGPTPTEHVLGGAGPYYSGGVVRALVVFGMVLTELADRTDRTVPVWAVAVAIGILEGATRLTLGRHWPFDVVMAVPVGCGLLWCYREARGALGLTQ